jgi:hypothetical protein
MQVTAVWLADAALQLQHPDAPMYAHLNKLLSKRPALNLQASICCTIGTEPKSCLVSVLTFNLHRPRS